MSKTSVGFPYNGDGLRPPIEVGLRRRETQEIIESALSALSSSKSCDLLTGQAVFNTAQECRKFIITKFMIILPS